MAHLKRRVSLALALYLAIAALTGCMGGIDSGGRNGETWVPSDEVPKLPESLKKDDATGIPILKVYDKAREKTETLDVERYIEGVVAGEMKSDWPLEALKAQAILARTFVMRFCSDKRSKYKGADISTDVTEAQAYDAEAVDDRVRQAVEETRGQVMAWRGEFPRAWFHAHSGGMTELPTVALDFDEADPEYLEPVRSEEPDEAPDAVKRWSASFNRKQVEAACANAGADVGRVESVSIGETGSSGRAKTLLVNGKSVSAPSFRIQIGANELKSTLIEGIKLEGDTITFSGRGFGHGVGMSQWGAYAMAKRGEDARQIIGHYFKGVNIVKLW